MLALMDGLDVSRETEAKLRAYADLLRKWTARINLISKASIDTLWSRHILDSAQILTHYAPPSGAWADFGSGGGLPGIVCAILCETRAPDTKLHLVESDQRKATFLRTAARELSLDLSVQATRAETLDPLAAETLSARALATLGDLLPLMERHGTASSTGLFLKGASAKKEIAEARQSWEFDLEAKSSLTNPDASLLIVRNLHRAA